MNCFPSLNQHSALLYAIHAGTYLRGVGFGRTERTEVLGRGAGVPDPSRVGLEEPVHTDSKVVHVIRQSDP